MVTYSLTLFLYLIVPSIPASLTLSHVTSNPSERLKITWTDTSNAAGVTYTAVLYEGSNKNGDMKQMRTGLTR